MAIDHRPPVILLMGPTASGKTALALALHDRLPADLISVDAAQVYRGMDIGTAKPTAEEQARAPHRLIDIRDPSQPYSAAQFAEDARAAIREITASGRIPLLVGGTMFYFRALQQGLSVLPSADEELRAQLTEEAERCGWPAMHRRLQQLDPAAAGRIHPNDRQRVQRALEIALLTSNEPQRQAVEEPVPYRFIKLGIWPADRAQLHSAIAARFHRMLSSGLIPEAEGLYRRPDLSLKLPSMRIVGYRQIWDYLSGGINYNEMVERGIAATRQLAKRQLTWLRAEHGVYWLDDTVPRMTAAGVSFIQQNLDRAGIIG